MVLFLRGEMDRVDEMLEGRRGSTFYNWENLRAWRQVFAGNAQAAVDALPDVAIAAGIPYVTVQIEMQRAGVLWWAGKAEQAKTSYRRYLEALEASGHRGLGVGRAVSARDFVVTSVPYGLDLAAVHLASPVERDALRVIIREQPGWNRARVTWYPHCAQRVYGDWAVTLDMPEDAGRLYRDALAWCERERCPIEAGRCHQGLAELASRHGDLEAARVHLDAAGELFARHGAKLFLEQVIAKKEILRA